ncbi:MAG TPA: hypothetical protein VH350_00205 [Candidatus Sulfotelmatobacter sp.]|nr:hypothetical protein [Candidatus Sulfotelmatobacter sp.]
MRRLLLLALLIAVTPWASAQRMSAASHFARSYRSGGHTRAFLDPLAFYNYSDFFAAGEYSSAAPPVMVVQSPPPYVPVPERIPAPADPLLIELQGSRYVRVSGSEAQQTETINRTPEFPPESNSPGTSVAKPAVAILIFHDGHREEISNYTIAGGVLYSAADYYATGSWNRKIQLSSLDLPGTIESNQSRGIKFRLPSSPNEVIVGP